MFRFDTRSKYDRVNRYIQAKKFYATLPHKLDRAKEEWWEAQPPSDDPWETKETGTFGQGDWSISTSYKPKDD